MLVIVCVFVACGDCRGQFSSLAGVFIRVNTASDNRTAELTLVQDMRVILLVSGTLTDKYICLGDEQFKAGLNSCYNLG